MQSVLVVLSGAIHRSKGIVRCVCACTTQPLSDTNQDLKGVMEETHKARLESQKSMESHPDEAVQKIIPIGDLSVIKDVGT